MQKLQIHIKLNNGEAREYSIVENDVITILFGVSIFGNYFNWSEIKELLIKPIST